MNSYLIWVYEQANEVWAWEVRTWPDKKLLQTGTGKDLAQAVIHATLWIAWQEETDFEIAVEVDGIPGGWVETVFWGPGASERCPQC